jgi:hypothetical protein
LYFPDLRKTPPSFGKTVASLGNSLTILPRILMSSAAIMLSPKTKGDSMGGLLPG